MLDAKEFRILKESIAELKQPRLLSVSISKTTLLKDDLFSSIKKFINK